MKKVLVIAAAALLMMGIAGQANATWTAWTDGDLIRVVYQVSAGLVSIDVATDLGVANTSGLVTSFQTGSNNTISLTTDGSGQFTGGSSTPGTLYVAYFAENDNLNGGNGAVWTSGPSTGTLNAYHSGTIANLLSALYGNYSTYTSTNTSWDPTSNNDNYYFTIDHNNTTTAGNFSTFLKTQNGEANLASLTATQGLYYWANPSVTGGTSNNASILTLTTTLTAIGNGDYTVTTTEQANQSAAPIPPSVLLFGSGLLGLIGIRRKS
jgi:hypothetical protein